MEEQLLDNLLDALDRLYDEQLHVVDLWALLLATAEALKGTTHYQHLIGPTTGLLAMARSSASDGDVRKNALVSTDSLRHYLAGLLPFD